MNRIAVLLALTVGLALPATASRAAELVMFERPGCTWCARFNAEIAPIYGKTDESRAAPLRRIDLNSRLPADLAGIDPGPFTPTFVVVQEGREIGRIRGYPGDAFFFGLLDRILSNTGLEPKGS
ncbi:thioredoxin [Bradyrhizobium amphicarpaeae]|uniref:Thioredoxin n=1 Tax=Bradyrhizobium amphicarpaeae TaxID=1404768 RepID=A0A2U8PRW9_9BRAD|nr:thioredoxin [Bradyrhizobium amphicarpaeae]AWM00530.1 thioredoxin [Bradyrhizobium amphicarpaeae]